MKRFLQQLPWVPLIVAALLVGLAPLLPQPHLIEKAIKIATGSPMRPIDYFDILFHLFPALIALLKWRLAE